MTRRRPERHAAEVEDGRASCRGADSLVERAALFVLLALIPLRAVASETRIFEVLRWLRNLEGPSGVTPATTLGIFAVVMLTAVAVLCARLWRGGPRYRWTGTEVGAGLLVIAGVVSTGLAGQKHLALAGVLDFLGCLLYMVVLRQLLVRPWHVRLALTVVLATGAMVVTKCFYQRLMELPDTIEYYEKHKAELTQPGEAGGDEAARSGALYDYEQRLYAKTVSGYFQHPNVLASYLILIVTASLAVAAGRWRRRPTWTLAVPLVLAGGAAVTFVWAQSKGAVLALLISLALWAIGGWLFRRHPTAVMRRRLAVAFWVVAVLGVVGLVAVLKARPDAMGRSMLFRSMYWQGAWNMLVHEGPLGVGADNFGRHFMRYKPLECPEDVDDPHSWVMKMASEWGVLGLAGLVVVLIGFSRRLAIGADGRESGVGDGGGRAAGNYSGGVAVRVEEGEASGGSIVLWAAGLGGAILAWWVWLFLGANSAYVVVTLVVLAFPWAIGALATAIEGTAEAKFLDDVPGPMLAGVCAGLIGFLVHSGIDLSLFRPGAATTFFAMMAIALALREASDQGGGAIDQSRDRKGADQTERPKSRLIAATFGVAGAAGVICVFALVVGPAAQLGKCLWDARRQAEPSPWNSYVRSPGYQAYQTGAGCYRLDGTADDELIEELIKRASGVDEVNYVISLNEELHRRDRDNSIYWHYLYTLYARRYAFGHDLADLEKSIAAMRQAVAAYPTSPKRHISLAEILAEQARATGSAEARRDAAAELQAALDLDAQRIYVSKPNRMTEEARAQIMDRIRRLSEGQPMAN